MRVVRDATEDEMVLAFLEAEIDSPRFGPVYLQVLGGRDLIDSAGLWDRGANRRRKAALAAVRGYGRNAFLFVGFPDHVDWKRVAVTIGELGGFLYARYPTWITLSGGTRLVRDGATNVDTLIAAENANEHIRAVELAMRTGRTYPPIIAASERRSSRHVIAEGHARATAYLRALRSDDEIEVLVGYSPSISSWALY